MPLARSQVCRRMPSANVFINSIPKGTPVFDCGRYYVAVMPSGPAVVNWEGRFAIEAQSRLRRAAIRGQFAGGKRRRRRRK